MLQLNGERCSPSADVRILMIMLVRTEHMVEQCFSNLGSAGRDWPVSPADFVYSGGGKR